MCFSYFALFSDEPEVFFPKYSQTAILHAAHFQRVVKHPKVVEIERVNEEILVHWLQHLQAAGGPINSYFHFEKQGILMSPLQLDYYVKEPVCYAYSPSVPWIFTDYPVKQFPGLLLMKGHFDVLTPVML